MADLLSYQHQFVSSRTSEEGFHSSSSTDENGSYAHYEIGTFSTMNSTGYPNKCNSDSGASSGDHDSTLTMKEECGVRDTRVVTAPATTGQLPGAWFYEMGDGSSSPTNEVDDLALSGLICAARNVTESVEVPSSEHVAEIVGRQGCKIKALRAKTNTYIKTPVRGEEPVFVVTGRPEDVMEAKREIECAAEHFTQIRASRRHSQGGVPAAGHVTAYVRVPLRVVGLVVGPKGATIKRIQQDTHTYIITPSREREPIFEVTGLPQNVEAARKEIEQHIYQRTGNMPITDPSASISQYSVDMQNANVGGVVAAPGCVSNRQQAAYGSLASSGRRPSGQEFAAPDYRQQIEVNTFNNFTQQFANMRPYGSSSKQSYSAGGSPPAASPSIFGSSSSSGSGAFGGQWGGYMYGNPNTAPNTVDTDALYRGLSTQLSGASAWSNAFGAPGAGNCNPIVADQRDEGLGDSPPSTVGNRGLVSIWSDIGDMKGNDTSKLTLLTA